MSNTPTGELKDFHADNYFREMEELDKMAERHHTMLTEHTARYYIPPQDETLYQMKESVGEMHKILLPTIQQMNHQSTVAEISNRLYWRLMPYVNEYNQCLDRALDFHDYNKCSRKIVNGFKNDGIEYAKELAREY